MTNQKHCERLEAVLSSISEQGIRTIAELKHPGNETLYAELWLAVQNFINFYALYSKSHYNAQKERVEGNAEKIRTLLSRGVLLEDIRSNILVHLLSKFDLVLAQPVEKQKNYCYRIVNNCVIDEFRKLPPAGIDVVSLHDKVKGGKVSSDDACELQNFIADPNTPEEEYLARERVKEIFAAKKEDLLNEITLLAKKPAEVLVRLCSKHLNMKPAAISALLMENGAAAAYAKVLKAVSEKYHVDLDAIRELVSSNAITQDSFKLDTIDEAKVSAQISRLAYRAEHRLCP
ncbi:hypothetical protein [Hominifimenecus sp. rT4P-3]|uniref:hypothetical protein n=1 Tax=Hominifimenecus sp. rT4P-3 TaxID=3242979 RepID=UPI003DA69815